MAGEVGAVSVAMEVSLYNLEAGLRRAETMTRTSAEKMSRAATINLKTNNEAIRKLAETPYAPAYSNSRDGMGRGDSVGMDKAYASAIKLGVAVKGVEGGLRLATVAAAAMTGDVEAGVEAMKAFPVAGKVFGAYIDFLDVAVGKSKAIAEAAEKAKQHREAEAKRGKELSDALHRQWEIESQMADRRKERILLQAEEGKDREIQAVKLDEQRDLDNTAYGSANFYDIKDTAAAKIADIEKRYATERQNRIRESEQRSQVLALEAQGKTLEAEITQIDFSYQEKIRAITDGEEKLAIVRERENAIQAALAKRTADERSKQQQEAEQKQKQEVDKQRNLAKELDRIQQERMRNLQNAMERSQDTSSLTGKAARITEMSGYKAGWSDLASGGGAAAGLNNREVAIAQQNVEFLAAKIAAAIQQAPATAKG